MFGKKKSDPKDEASGFAFVGFMFLGFTIAIFYHRWELMPFLGLGLGFIAMMAVKLKK